MLELLIKIHYRGSKRRGRAAADVPLCSSPLYERYINARLQVTGHLWQRRSSSVAMDGASEI